MNGQAWRSIILASLMKLLFKLVELEFSSLNPGKFHLRQSTNTSTETCYFDSIKSGSSRRMQTTALWLHNARYLIPVLGGLMSSAWLGCIRVLLIGGNVMLLSTALLSVSMYLGIMCQDSPVILIAWLLLPVFYGLLQPNILLALFHWHRRNRLCTAATSIYCAVAAFGDLISAPIVFNYLLSPSVLGNNFTLVFVAASFAFELLTILLPEMREDEPFEFPDKRKMMKMFQIFSAEILVFAVLNDTRSAIYLWEMSHFMNETIDTAVRPWLAPSWVRDISMVVTALLLILATAFSRRRLPEAPRMFAGILLKCAIEVALIIVTSVGPGSATATMKFYIAVFILNGVAQLLVTVAVYDLGCLLMPDNSQALVLGVMFTVWGLAVFVSQGLFALVRKINTVQTGSKHFFVYHLISVLMLITSFFYQFFVTVPMAKRMAPLSDEAEIDAAAQDPHTPDVCTASSSPELQRLL